jgi:hypothetical protein
MRVLYKPIKYRYSSTGKQAIGCQFRRPSRAQKFYTATFLLPQLLTMNPRTHHHPFGTSQQHLHSPTLSEMAETNATHYPTQQFQGAYSSHYTQALQNAHYLQAYSNNTASYGYGLPTFGSGASQNWHQSIAGPSSAQQLFRPPPNSSSWYTPGNCRCTYEGCAFVGSAKSLEIHRMDRHLIYPSGYKERKRKDDWDADPSLKG